MPRRKRVDHVVCGTSGAKCLHCGTDEIAPLPMPIPAFVLWCEAMIEKHRHCVAEGKEGDQNDAQ